MGHLAASERLDDATFRQAIVYGSVMASFDVEEFSLKGLSRLTKTDIEGRFRQFQKLTHFDTL
jgi:hypothetical protein